MQSRAMARTRQGFAPLMTLPLLMGLRLSGWSLSTLTGESRCLSIQLGAHNAINYPKGRSGDASSKLFKAFLPLWQRWAVEDTEKSSEFLRKEKKKGGCWHEGSCGFPQSLLRNRKQGGEEDVMPSDWAQISLSATILSVKYIPLYKQKYPPKNEPLAWGSKITHSEQGRPRWKNTQSIFPKIYHISSLSFFFSFFFPLFFHPPGMNVSAKPWDFAGVFQPLQVKAQCSSVAWLLWNEAQWILFGLEEHQMLITNTSMEMISNPSEAWEGFPQMVPVDIAVLGFLK